MRQTKKLLVLLEQNDYFRGGELTTEEKKSLSTLYTRPEYKALVKLMDLGILSLQRNVLVEGSTTNDITTFNWVLKVMSLIKSNVYHYHKSYANPERWKASSPEGLIQDLEALQTIAKANGQGESVGR